MPVSPVQPPQPYVVASPSASSNAVKIDINNPLVKVASQPPAPAPTPEPISAPAPAPETPSGTINYIA